MPNDTALYKYFYIYLILIASLLFTGSCAKIGSPTGGPKDEEPPEVVESKPAAMSTHFSGNKIEITFDEYVQLKDIYTQLVISPPLEDKPYVRTKGKSVVVELKNDLDSNTTYTISFGDAIADNNEGNVLPNYQFPFSTGSYLDSMSVSGKVLIAQNLNIPEEPVLVGLYANLNDSAPLVQPPKYVGKTNSEGNFEINNVKPGDYKVFALTDLNADLFYDLADEKIAFSDTVVPLLPSNIPADNFEIEDSTLYKKLSDSLLVDSTLNVDSLLLASNAMRKLYGYHMKLYLFSEDNKTQYLNDYKRKSKYRLDIYFNRNLDDFFEISPLFTQYKPQWSYEVFNKSRDSLTVWLSDSNLYNNDSLVLNVKYHVKDSSNNIVIKSDTLLFRYTEETVKSKRKKEKEEEAEEQNKRIPLKLNSNAKSTGRFDLNKEITIESETPVFYWNPDKIELYVLEDTIYLKQDFEAYKDTGHLSRFFIKTEWEENMPYKLLITDSAFVDIYGSYNDSTEFKFVTQRLEYYGILSYNISGIKHPVIIQLLDKDGKVVREKEIYSDTRITFDYLSAKEYKLRAIIDSNDNGRWDTGNYLKKIQPEKVINFPESVNVRSNWEIEHQWTLPD